MDRDKLKVAVAEAERFIKRAKALPKPVEYKRQDGSIWMDDNHPVEQSAIRRSTPASLAASFTFFWR